jgi:beta-phosphoglucomutase-like phosphatase (HAD superfamily)
VEAALNAGMKTVVITTLHQPDEFKNYPNVIRLAKDFTGLVDIIQTEKTLNQALS